MSARTGVGGAAGAGLDTGDEVDRAGGVGAGLLVGGATAPMLLLACTQN